jgi:hypothetical protein
VFPPSRFGTRVQIGAALALGKPLTLQASGRNTPETPYACAVRYHPAIKLFISTRVRYRLLCRRFRSFDFQSLCRRTLAIWRRPPTASAAAFYHGVHALGSRSRKHRNLFHCNIAILDCTTTPRFKLNHFFGIRYHSHLRHMSPEKRAAALLEPPVGGKIIECPPARRCASEGDRRAVAALSKRRRFLRFQDRR